MQKLLNTQPNTLWNYFNEILQIPRPSGKEEQIRTYLIEFAKNLDLDYTQDKIGNLIIRKPAAPGYEDHPGVILQSHLDMVCEKNASLQFDFLTDAIPAYVDGNWVKSKGTTLGADDGIGIATQMAILADKSVKHGPLECLFTIEEETGLTGANQIDPNVLTGTLLLNLDSEDEGEIFIGCAGGVDVTAWFDFEQKSIPENHQAFKLSVTGLQGGHSGDEIHKGLGNSIKTINRFLWEHADELQIKVHKLEGGNLRNAIPREAFAEFLIPVGHEKELLDKVAMAQTHFDNEHIKTAPEGKIDCVEISMPAYILDEDTQVNLLNALYACPHGVHAWSQSMEGIVETSTNLAAVKLENNRFRITTSQRSSIESSKTDIANMVEAVFLMAGAETKRSGGYPGWSPNPDSDLVKAAARLYQNLFNEKPIVRAIHAGLECGLFLEKYPHLDMISFGPTIKGAHSPDERLDIHTTQKFYTFLIDLLKEL